MRNAMILVGMLMVAGCGVSDAQVSEVDGETSEELGELGTSTRSYVVLRRDLRRCISPMCGGYWAHDVNRATLREVYVSGLDFTGSGLSDEAQNAARGGADFEVVLYGKLGPAESRFNTRPFVVTAAWRGMPGVTFAAGDLFYKVEPAHIQCITAPCATLRATKLHTSSKTLHHDLDVARASLPYVDQDWLTARVVNKGALVAGRFVDGAQVGVGRERVLDASQVFIKLPDTTQACALPPVARCLPGKVNVYTRDENRCVMPAGCAVPGACAAFVPECAAGYTLTSWVGGTFACNRYACDPSFLFGERGLLNVPGPLGPAPPSRCPRALQAAARWLLRGARPTPGSPAGRRARRPAG